MMTTTTTTPCVHHWSIQPPNGATSAAYCKKCGAEKSFRNSLNNDLSRSDLSARGQSGRMS